MRGDPTTSHNARQEEGENLEAEEVDRTMYMVDPSLQLKHKFMVCGRTREMIMWCNGSWTVYTHCQPFLCDGFTTLGLVF